MSRKAKFLNALRCGKPSAPVWAEMYIDENLKKEFASEIPVGMTFEEYAGMSAISLAGPYYPPGFIEEIDGVMTPQLQNRGDLGKMVFPDADDERFYEPAKKFLANAPEGLAIGVSTDLAAGAALASMGVEGFSYALADDPDFVAEVFSVTVNGRQRFTAIFAEWVLISSGVAVTLPSIPALSFRRKFSERSFCQP